MANRSNSRGNGSAVTLARGLGWFSIGLGLAEVLIPRTLAKELGMAGSASPVRFYGAPEIAAGIGILMSDNPAPWIWGRVAGDALDLWRGMPKPPDAMRGAARNFPVPRDMRTPEALRPFASRPVTERPTA